MKLFSSLILILLQPIAFSAEKSFVDHILHEKIRSHNLRPLAAIAKNPNRAQVELGKRLFSDTILSGNNRVSCQTCHTKEGSTSDKLPLSRSEDGKGILRRNTPSLFNSGLMSKSFMFLDGRVQFDTKKKIFTTPEDALNGEKPKASNITSVMSSSLAAQALFPIVAHDEMLGRKGENEIADSKTNLEAWDKIVSRLKKSEYARLFQQAYPSTPVEKINIGHVGEAIAAFEREEFTAMNTPLQRYLNGDDDALTTNQKRGFFIFMGSGKCINCHKGGDLGDDTSFASVAAPQWGASPFTIDKGRALVTNNPSQNFFFKVPSLINVALTAPYMHNGAYQNLKEVINHYSHISETLNNFDLSNERRSTIPVEVSIANNPAMLDDIWLSSQTAFTPKLKNRLFLHDSEKEYLEIFLREALTDPRWKK